MSDAPEFLLAVSGVLNLLWPPRSSLANLSWLSKFTYKFTKKTSVSGGLHRPHSRVSFMDPRLPAP